MNVKCPIIRCTNQMEPWHLTCPFHWRQVPKKTQVKLYKLFKEAQGSDEHRRVSFAILDILNTGAQRGGVQEGAAWP